ncbi:hypothetical protein MRX96_007658 [Rhipicephalus microplus]
MFGRLMDCSVGQEEAAEVLESLNRRVIEATHISSLCPRRKLMCHPDLPFRQPDGICNNLENPEWGSAGVCERRILRPDYGDGVSSPRTARSGRPLPSSRLISLLVHDGSGLFREPDERVSQLSIGFGQFLGHDLGFTPFLRLSPLELKMGRQPGEVNPDDALPIKVPDKDPLSARFHQSTLPFFRSRACLRCRLGFREQMNSRTSYADLSAVYGVSKEILETLREFRGGLLKSQMLNGTEFPPPSAMPMNDNCSHPGLSRMCFRTGNPTDEKGRDGYPVVTEYRHTLTFEEGNGNGHLLGSVDDEDSISVVVMA